MYHKQGASSLRVGFNQLRENLQNPLQRSYGSDEDFLKEVTKGCTEKAGSWLPVFPLHLSRHLQFFH